METGNLPVLHLYQQDLGADENLGKRRIDTDSLLTINGKAWVKEKYILIHSSYNKWGKLEAAVSFGMAEIAPDDNIQGFSGNSQ